MSTKPAGDDDDDDDDDDVDDIDGDEEEEEELNLFLSCCSNMINCRTGLVFHESRVSVY